MARSIIKIVPFLALFLLLSCSDDDGRKLGENGFTFNGGFHVLNNAFVTDENIVDETPGPISIVLSNVNLNDSTAVSNISKIYFDFNGVNLEAGTITDIPNYSIQTGGAYVQNTDDDNYTYVDGTFLLKSSEAGLNATEKTVTINSVSENKIDLTFQFVRSDGQTFSGKYNGLFTDLSSNE
ncbi:MAG: hypothetical protein DI588_00060 [Flavobacterium johnsoniae]|nr:MAG: hypothetical protein DI588_00060 [Flavobacterium johnsoniae]